MLKIGRNISVQPLITKPGISSTATDSDSLRSLMVLNISES
jgi:hypothetical protein